MILIDNYDSFTYNIVEYLNELNINPKVLKNDEITINELKKMDFQSIIISPGPGNPKDKKRCGICEDVIKTFYKSKKILGICLGFQLIAYFFGADIVQDNNPYHGKISKIKILEKTDLFKDITDNFETTRYHSLIVEKSSLPKTLVPLAQTEDKSEILMALKHINYPIFGVQFHPEAILTQYGHELLKNFVDI